MGQRIYLQPCAINKAYFTAHSIYTAFFTALYDYALLPPKPLLLTALENRVDGWKRYLPYLVAPHYFLLEGCLISGDAVPNPIFFFFHAPQFFHLIRCVDTLVAVLIDWAIHVHGLLTSLQ